MPWDSKIEFYLLVNKYKAARRGSWHGPTYALEKQLVFHAHQQSSGMTIIQDQK
jgi:hypothetical protein